MPVVPFSISFDTRSAPSRLHKPRNLFLRIVDAIGDANRRKAEREIARFYAREMRFTDSVERSICERFEQH